MRLLVTGGSGFTGQRVIPRLVADGHHVVGLARSPAAAERISRVGAEPVRGDLDDPASIDAAFRQSGTHGLVHVASLGFGHGPAIIAAAQEAGHKRCLFVSTTGIFTSLSAPSKSVRLQAEDAIRASGLDWTIVRPTMIYGAPGDRNMSRLLGALRWTPVFPLPHGGRGLQQPVHVEDLAMAIASGLATKQAIGQIYDIAGPTALTFRSVVELAAQAVGRRPWLVPVPLPPLIHAVRAYERLASAPKVKAEQLERLAEDKTFDIDRARRDLGYGPRSFETGIRAEAALLG